MNKYMLPIVLLFFNLGCNSADENQGTKKSDLPAQDMMNVSYGSNAQQKMDIYLPAGRNAETKVFILVHGGGWSGGDKAEFNYVIPTLKKQFPDHAIVNINYRLATAESPAFPKQIQDIEQVMKFLKNSDYSISDKYAFIGASAGAHLSMLYSYKYDKQNNIKAVCSIVGPADFTDPYYTSNPYYTYTSLYLVGNGGNRPEAAIAVSPAQHVNADSPPTILFYGGQDMLVPSNQADRLKAKLDQYNVYNEYYLYADGGHGNWNVRTRTDFQEKMINFFREQF